MEATGERHHGPAATAKQRAINELEGERVSILRTMARQLIDRIGRHRSIGKSLQESQPVQPSPHAEPPPRLEISPLEALAQRFPDRKKLRSLSALDFSDYSVADFQKDRWYSPAFNLSSKLQRQPLKMFRMVDGEVHLEGNKLDDREKALLAEKPHPDIVQDALDEAMRQFWQHQASLEKRDRETKELRRKTLEWLRTNNVWVFDDEYNIRQELRPSLPAFVIDMPGVREAMRQSHVRWLAAAEPVAEREEQREEMPVKASSAPESEQEVVVEDDFLEAQRLQRLLEEQQAKHR